MLNVVDRIPDGLLQRDSTRLHEVLPGPTLIELEGRRAEPLYVSALLHGNEDTGWETVRRLLSRYGGKVLPRALAIFIGNVAAARHGLRRLDDQPDYNRVWKSNGTPEHEMMQQIIQRMRRRRVFASVDIHNNTGVNPHYACVNSLAPQFLHLATLFSRTVVYFTTPDTVQSRAFADLCPAVTVEAGQPGQAHGVDHAMEYVDACLHLTSLPDHAVAPSDIDLFHTMAVVRIPEEVSFGFDNHEHDIQFVEDLDHMNFRELPKGTTLGWLRTGSDARLHAWDEQGTEVGHRYFGVRGKELVTAVPVMPSMLTRDERVIRQDCLCYLMERYTL